MRFLSRDKETCRECAYLHYNFFDEIELWNCSCDKSSIRKEELDSRTCREFIRKKQGVNLEQQVQEKQQKKFIVWLRRNASILSIIIAVVAAIITLVGLLHSFGYL